MQEDFDFCLYGTQVRTLSCSLLATAHSVAELCGAMHLLTVAAEKDLRRFGESPDDSRVACGPGCSSCCILNVSVLLPEAIAIASYLQKRLTGKDLDPLCDRLQELRIRTRWLDDEERIFVREACAFLDLRGDCIIHQVRPLLCRSITSTRAAACHDAIVMAPMEGQPAVEMNLFQKQLFETIYSELATALKAAELDPSSGRLSSTILSFLKEPELMMHYLSGAKIAVN